ncbi:MAG: glycosyltransferase family 2 protein [Akkermansiaceae bacterium]|nr:glycosyltransferase family 2 protein [Akkermansiaceae bacterium]
MTDLSIIIVNWNTRELLRACLASVNQHTTGLEHEVIVVDNHSADGSPAMVRAEFPEVRLIENPQNLGFAAGNNQGIRLARGRAVLLLNSDTELVENSAKTLFDFLFSKETIGAAGGLLIYPGGGAQWSYGYEPSLGRMLWITLSGLLRIPWGRKPVAIVPGTDAGPRPVEYIVGADLMIKKNVLDRVGLLDESFFAYFEETDLCARIRQAGFEVRYTPATRILHRIGSSFSADATAKLRIYYTSLFRYLQKHRGGYHLVKVYLLAKFGVHALWSRGHEDARNRFRAIWMSGLEYPRRGDDR